jgi:hypothetical protein
VVNPYDDPRGLSYAPFLLRLIAQYACLKLVEEPALTEADRVDC